MDGNVWLTRTSQSNSVSIIAYKFGEQTSFRLCTGVELVLHIIDLKKKAKSSLCFISLCYVTTINLYIIDITLVRLRNQRMLFHNFWYCLRNFYSQFSFQPFSYIFLGWILIKLSQLFLKILHLNVKINFYTSESCTFELLFE